MEKAIVVMLPKTVKPKSVSSRCRHLSLLSLAGTVNEAFYCTVLKRSLTLGELYRSFSLDFGKDSQVNGPLALLTIRRQQALSSLTLRSICQVWHEGLLQKLRSISVPHGRYNVLKSFLNGRVFKVRVGDNRSSFLSLTAEAPQGDPSLAPFYFSLHERCVRTAQPSLYADDTIVYFSSKSPAFLCKHLKRYLDALAVWCRG
jgi:hypothetical protein